MEDHRTPGELIASLLTERGWKKRVLAAVLGIDETIVNRMVAGSRRIDAPMALLLEEVFQVRAIRFLELQSKYDLAMAQIVARPDPRRGQRARLFGDLPVTEMIKRGWLDADDVRNVPDVEAAILKFFGVGSLDEIEIFPHSAHKTATSSPATTAQLAWLYRVRQIAGEMIVGRYSPKAVRAAIDKLSSLLYAASEVRHVPKILAEAGIRFVIVESLKGAKIDGVCFWLNDFSPVIGMSLRYDRIDNFWWVLRHECEHVLRRDGRLVAMLDVELEGERAGTGPSVPEEERVANRAASEFCVPANALEQFIARKEPVFAEQDLIGFSRTIRVHPGIIVGQIQHATQRYNLRRKHLTPVRESVAPGASVDGWGDVYPIGEESA